MSITKSMPLVSSPAKRVFWDVGQLAAGFKFWVFLAWLEVRQQYRRSSLGPFWITMTTAGYVFALVFVFGVLFKIRSEDYAPWVTLGIISWNFITACLTDASGVLIAKRQLLAQRQMSHNGLVFSVIVKSLLIFFHQIPIYVGVMIFFQISFTAQTLLLFLTLPILVWALQPLAVFIAYLSMRLRDVPPLVTAVLTPMFFVTPIMWTPEQLGDMAWISDWNPFASMIGLIREPLLGRNIPIEMIVMVIGTGALMWVMSIAFQIKFRRRIMYWA